jgi:hypothetical protein
MGDAPETCLVVVLLLKARRVAFIAARRLML